MLEFLTNGADFFDGNNLVAETVFGRGGDDYLGGAGFGDMFRGGRGDDGFEIDPSVSGGPIVLGDVDAPVIYGGPGEDTVYTYPEHDVEIREFRLFNAARIHFEDSGVTVWAFGVENFEFTLI